MSDNDTNKPEQNIDVGDNAISGHDILDSDNLFDLDMPIDEPDEEEPINAPEEASAEALEKELEQLLEHGGDPVSAQQPEHADDSETPQPDRAGMDTPPAPEPAEAAPKAEPVPEQAAAASQTPISTPACEPEATVPKAPQAAAKTGRSLANSLMFTLGLAAILVASLAVWMGLNASDENASLKKTAFRLEQQIKELKQQQKQQSSALNSRLETMQQQIDALTKVVASKTSEQWRAVVEQPTPTQKAPRSTAATLPSPTPSQAVVAQQAVKLKPEHTANRTKKRTAHLVASRPPVKTVHSSPAKAIPSPLFRHEVAPGSVKGWVVNIYSVESRETAERKIRQLKAKDIQAHFVRVPVKGRIWYRVRVSGFKNERAAMVFKKFLKDYHGIDGAWYQKLK